MSTAAAPPPDAVRVWRGFKSPSLGLTDFNQRLGTIFIPATVLMQIDAGLCAYVPTVIAGLSGKPDAVPDETAILFWGRQQTYRDAFKTLAVRTYTLTHGSVYVSPSGADFPEFLEGSIKANRPYYLISAAADWMHGEVVHLVGARPATATSADFRIGLARALSAIHTGNAQGAIVCAGEEYVVYWQLGQSTSTVVDQIRALCDWSRVFDSKPLRINQGLWDDWPGLKVEAGTSWNFQFERRK